MNWLTPAQNSFHLWLTLNFITYVTVTTHTQKTYNHFISTLNCKQHIWYNSAKVCYNNSVTKPSYLQKIYVTIFFSSINHDVIEFMFHKQQEGEVHSKAPMKVAKRHDNIALHSMPCDHCPYRPHRFTNNERTNRDGNWKKKLPKRQILSTFLNVLVKILIKHNFFHPNPH